MFYLACGKWDAINLQSSSNFRLKFTSKARQMGNIDFLFSLGFLRHLDFLIRHLVSAASHAPIFQIVELQEEQVSRILKVAFFNFNSNLRVGMKIFGPSLSDVSASQPKWTSVQ